MGDIEPAKEPPSSAKNTQQSGCGGVGRWTEGKISEMDECMNQPVSDVLHNLQDVLMAGKQVKEMDEQHLRQIHVSINR